MPIKKLIKPDNKKENDSSGKRKKSVLSREKQIEEIRKCGSDASYFIKNYVKISHPMKGLVPFETFKYQDECLEAFQEHRFVIVNKSRQLGLSTISAAYSLWMAIFQREKNILVIATKLDVAKLFIQKVRTMYNALPSWLVIPKVSGESVKYLNFSNGSRIQADSTSANSARGQAISCIIADEAAHIDGIEELYLSLRPTISTGGSIILISSPSGVGTLFHKIWLGATENKDENNVGIENGYYAIELPWTVHPDRDQAWFEKEKKDIIQAMGEAGVAQELLCLFTSSGDTFIKGEALDYIFKNIKQPIIKNYINNDEIWIWKHPELEHGYILSADVSRGDGDDFSAFHIIDITTDEIAADFKGKMRPDKFAHLMVEWAEKYNNALLCPELNNVGVVAAIELKKIGYQNIYYKKQHQNIISGLPVLQSLDDSELPGFTLDANSRIEILMKLANKLQNRQLKVYSERLYKELQTFIWKNNKPQARKHYHDDMVIALAIGNSLFDANGKNSSYSANDAMLMAAAFSRDLKQLNTLTGQTKTNQNKTSDGFWDVGSRPTSGIDDMKKLGRQSNKIHNYNEPQWGPFGWVFRDD